MQGCLTKLRILFHCLLDGGQFSLSRSTKKCLDDTKPHKRTKLYIHLCTAKLHIHRWTDPAGRVGFF